MMGVSLHAADARLRSSHVPVFPPGASRVGESSRRCGSRVTLPFALGGVCLLALLAGCGESPQLTLYCGAGIRPPVAEAVEEFRRREGVTVECDYAGSEVLLSRIKLAERGDLYMPGEVYYVDLAREQGLVATSKTVCYFVPVILVQKGNPKGIQGLEDLLRPELKVGLGDAEACAIGRQCAMIFEKSGIDAEQIDRHVDFRSMTVNELANSVKVEALDAAIVWDGVAATVADTTDVVPIPLQQNVVSTVAIGMLASSDRPERAARFVEFLTSPRGREIFRKHHYTVDPPPGADAAP